ncbi:MAG: hypothetical protein ACK5RO_01365 [Pseudobdellovibrionaceae bacterium]
MRQYNEKPSNISNLGSDISGAARHHRDTYETPEELRAKAFKKQSTANLKALQVEYQAKLTEALKVSTEAAQNVLKDYEFDKAIASAEVFSKFKDLESIKARDVNALKSIVLAETDQDSREIMRKAFNKMATKRHNIRYIRPIELSKYFEKKSRDSFTEQNGVKRPWKLEQTIDINSAKDTLSKLTRAVQFGNSIPDSERVYCLANLKEALDICSETLSYSFKELGFSFGARGKAGSVAHYQDSSKVLAFNRHWDGAFLHELGHAIDYSLGLVSSGIPSDYRQAYLEKLEANKVGSNQHYYMNRKEIFARLFEVYFRDIQPKTTDWMQTTFNDSVMPELTPEIKQWMTEALKPLLKG